MLSGIGVRLGRHCAFGLQIQESSPHKLGGRQIVGGARLAPIELGPAQGANIHQHAIAGKQQ
jgi:hypothetical protein